MGETNQQNGTQQGTQGTEQPQGTPPAATPPPAAQQQNKQPAATQQTAQTEGAAKEPKPEPKRVRLSGADEEIPEDAELIEMSSRTLKSRLNSAKKSEVRALFEKWGVKDADELQQKLARAKELEAAEEERKRADMTENEKLQADLRKERQLRSDAERREFEVTRTYVVDSQQRRISRIAAQFIDRDYIEQVLPQFAAHLRKNYDENDLKTLKDQEIAKFFADYVKEKPKLAREKPKPRVPLTNGARTADRPQAGENGQSGKSNNRNFAPSAENAMSRNEARAEAAKLGYRW